jgi:STIP1 family protein 1
MKKIFEKIEQEDKKNKKIPEYLICPIKDDLMDQPVILDPSGFTYEKNEIINHFKVNGNIDPLSREMIKNSEKLIDN